MAAFGFSVGDIIATIELCRKLIGAFQSTTGAAAKYQRIIVELESLARILREVETLSATGPDDVHQRIDSIRAVAMATMYPMREFAQELQKYEHALFPIQQPGRARSTKVARSLQWAMGMDEEIQKLQSYINGQMLSINALLQLLARDVAAAREVQRASDHQALVALFGLQAAASASIGSQMSSLNDAQSHQTGVVQSIARQSLLNGQLLAQVQQSILSIPSTGPADVITLHDPLGRKFNLPFTYFQHWQLVESFISQQFSSDQTPGSAHVKAGEFFLSREGSSNALSKSTWGSTIYPGAALNMTIVLTIVQMQLRTCPRPGCECTVPDAAEMTTFQQCPKCQLTFRFDPDTNAVGLHNEAEKLRLAQQHEDLDAFGRRQEPADVVEVYSDDGEELETGMSDEGDSENEEGSVARDELDDLIFTERAEMAEETDEDDYGDETEEQEKAGEGRASLDSESEHSRPQAHHREPPDAQESIDDMEDVSSISSHYVDALEQASSSPSPPSGSPTPDPTLINPNIPPQHHVLPLPQSPPSPPTHDPSAITTWLQYTATPSPAAAHPVTLSHPFLPKTTFPAQTSADSELKALKTLTRVQFIHKVPETVPLQDTVATYAAMPLDAQIYLRKVVDRFPCLPPYLAERFADANVRRGERLRGRRMRTVGAVC